MRSVRIVPLSPYKKSFALGMLSTEEWLNEGFPMALYLEYK